MPPEEFGIERVRAACATAITASTRSSPRRESHLIAEGFDAEQIRSLADYTGATEIETLARDTVEEHFATGGDDGLNRRRPAGPDHRALCADGLRGQRPAGLYQVITGGDQGEVLRQDGDARITPFDAIPFAAMTPVLGDASLLRPLDRRSRDATAAGEDRAEARRARQSLSAQQSAGRGRRKHAGPNTLDDLLVSRPGGVVRTKTPGGLNWQVVPDITGSIFPMLNISMPSSRPAPASRKQAQGIDANALQNQSATAVAQVFSPRRCASS